MYTHHPIQNHTTTTGLKFTLVPAPRFSGCTIDPSGKPIALIYPTGGDCPKTELPLTRLYPDLKGLNTEDVERYKPSFILYRLNDGTLLKADSAAILKAGNDTNSASNIGLSCLMHLVKDLVIVEMPEVEEVPVYDFSN